MTDTSKQLNMLNIVKGTVTQAQVRDLDQDTIYYLDPQFVGDKILTSNADGSFKEAETVTMKVTFSDGTQSDFYIKG